MTPPAIRDVAGLHAFLAPNGPDVARRTIATIRRGVRWLPGFIG